MEHTKTLPITVRIKPETRALIEQHAVNSHSMGAFIDQAVKAFVVKK